MIHRHSASRHFPQSEIGDITMKILLLFSLAVCSIISSDSRLIEKITDRTLTTENKTGSSPPVRLARQAYGDYMVGLNDNEGSNEFFTSFNRKVRHFNIGSKNPEPPSRLRRDSNEHIDKPVKNNTVSITTAPSTDGRGKPKTVLVKKPIPKYNEMDYDDDFQMKMSKYPVKLFDSGEHEDEDFNLNDYDFDVNHDEFIGRGKPLEPRTKHRDIVVKPKPESKLSVAPEIKIKSKVNIPHQVPSNKKERSAEKQKKTNEKEKDDYYDESTSTTKEPQKARELEDEFNDDNEESKEFFSKLSNIRLARSPWNVNSLTETFGDKATAAMSKVLSILPMFPQVPDEGGAFEYRVGTGHSNGWSNRGLNEWVKRK